MSEQIQSLLNEIENKFEESFSQSIHEQPINKDLNPQSAKKTDIKHQINKKAQEPKSDDFDQMKILLLEELNQHKYNQEQNDNNLEEKQQNIHNNQNEHLKTKSSNNNKKQNTPNFKYKEQYQQESLQNFRKVTSQQHFSKTDHQSTQSHEENPFYYKELTMKLQRALLKISSDKVVGPVRKSYDFYDRVEQFQQKKKRQIQRKKQQLQEKQINSVQDRPLINSHSRALVAQISNDPIYVRCQRILQKRKQKQEEYKRIKQSRQEKQYEQFKQQFDTYMNEVKQKYEEKGVRSAEEYYHQQQTWVKTKQKNIQSKITQQNQKIKNQLTFRPLINSKSQKIIQNKKQEKHVSIFDRQPKQKQQIKDPNCTFKPKINKSNFYKKMTYYQTSF